ncbi:AraC family transcriptional regulator [Conyzicola sp.]|uniref:AraC family transcriptional regulator n=1 Tax=Conyzicola sp. TaxID=1969404 RepID=UPI0039896CDC
MDPLAHLLDGPRAHRAFALRVVMAPGWSIDVRDEAPLTVIAMMTGSAVLASDGVLHDLEPGDVALVRGPAPYSVSDDASRAPDAVIHPGQLCTTPTGEHLDVTLSHGVRTWGNSPLGQTSMLIGTYTSDAEVSRAVTAALPRVAVARSGQIDPALVALLGREITSDASGQGSTVDRLLDVLLVHTIRVWASEHPESARGWLAGRSDPLVARALELFHGDPGAAWTLDVLARRLNVSRATVASRFRATVGESPISYLTNWRMLLASEMLARPEATTSQIATEVGYGSPFALSTAFKRRFLQSPTEYRRRVYPASVPVRRRDVG